MADNTRFVGKHASALLHNKSRVPREGDPPLRLELGTEKTCVLNVVCLDVRSFSLDSVARFASNAVEIHGESEYPSHIDPWPNSQTTNRPFNTSHDEFGAMEKALETKQRGWTQSARFQRDEAAVLSNRRRSLFQFTASLRAVLSVLMTYVTQSTPSILPIISSVVRDADFTITACCDPRLGFPVCGAGTFARCRLSF